MNFRLADMQDLQQLHSMYQEIIRDMCEKGIDIWDEIYPCAFFADDIRQKKLYVLCDGETIAAAYTLCDSNPGSEAVVWQNDTGKALYLDRFGVNVRCMRKGIGSIMLQKAEETARQQGAAHLRLFVVDINTPAIRLYEKNGFARASGRFDEVIDDDLTLHEYGYEKAL